MCAFKHLLRALLEHFTTEGDDGVCLMCHKAKMYRSFRLVFLQLNCLPHQGLNVFFLKVKNDFNPLGAMLVHSSEGC